MHLNNKMIGKASKFAIHHNEFENNDFQTFLCFILSRYTTITKLQSSKSF